MKKCISLILLCSIVVLTSCSLSIIAPTETTIKAENNLTDLSIVVSGSTTKVTAIDLADVTIGDVFFSYIQGGKSTVSKVTYKTGSVDIYIDTAIVLAKVLGITTELAFPNIDKMSATITPDITNTIIFDESTAKVIFQGLAKKRVP